MSSNLLVNGEVNAVNNEHGTVVRVLEAVNPPGTILSYAGTTPPKGYLLCDGAVVSRVTYSALFAVIGVTFGSGNSSDTFHLPDLQGRVIVGAGQGVGLSRRNIAEKAGEESHTLSVGEMPAHTHTQNPHTHVPANGDGNKAFMIDEPVSYGWGAGAQAGGFQRWGSTAPTTATNQNTGGGEAHNNMPPFLVINHIIKY